MLVIAFAVSPPLPIDWRTNLKCTYLLASVVLASVTSAQVSVDWRATHDMAPSLNNEFGAIAVDATGRVAVGGQSRTELPASGGVSFGDFETCLYESDGTLAWSRSRHVSYKDVCNAVAFDGRGGIFVAGTASEDDLGQTNYRVLLHYDAIGNLLWSNYAQLGTWGSTNQGNALALCANGDVIVAGALNSDLSLERFDPAGNLLWSWIADGGNGLSDSLSAVVVGPDGDVWATGRVGAPPPPNWTASDLVVVRVSSAGVPVWIRTEGGMNQSSDYGNALVVDAAGHASVAGSIGGDAAVARWGPAGHLGWIRTYNGGLGGDAKRIELDPFGRIVAAGTVYSGAGNPDFAVWCHDTAGNLTWKVTFDAGLSGSAYLGDLVVDAMGAVWLCGSIPNNYLVIASWDSTGAFRWSWRTPTNAKTHAHAAALSGNDVIVAGGFFGSSGQQWDGLVLRLTRTAVEYCFGDGSNTPCPCANASDAEQHAGCANSLSLGARLVDKGTSSLAADTLVLEGSQMPDGDALYFQGRNSMSGGMGEPFGDGLSCVGGALIRLGSSTNVSGASHFPEVGDPSVSTRGLVTTPGSRRTYQVWYRDASVFCTTANFNFSNGLFITWTL